jgi:hypothetical protein
VDPRITILRTRSSLGGRIFGQNGQQRLDHARVELRGVVGVELDDERPVGGGRGGAQYRLVAFVLEELPLGRVGARVGPLEKRVLLDVAGLVAGEALLPGTELAAEEALGGVLARETHDS